MLSLHGRENITEFVLHDLSHEKCFDLNKSAFLVNNPDFNCLKGVAGVSSSEIPQGLWTNIWDQSEKFSTYMKNSPFNRKVRNFAQCSLERTETPSEEIVKNVAHSLGIDNPAFFSLDMRHGNHGLFIFQKNIMDNTIEEHLSEGISLLGFCPIF